jgi:Tyrosine phosphatase family
MIEVIPGILFRSARPGYNGKLVTEAEVARWVTEAMTHGIKTILCLLDHAQLAYYGSVPGGLLGYYRQAGFAVVHLPVADHQRPAVPPEVLAIAYSDFLSAQKPLLVHCSAGFDRTGAVVNYLLEKWPGASRGESSGQDKG